VGRFQTWVIANQKGGVGKTTTTVNLGAALARQGMKVLLIDMDPQGNLTQYLGRDPEGLENSIYDLLIQSTKQLKHLHRGVGLQEVIQQTDQESLEFIPANLDLSFFDLTVASINRREYLLKSFLEEEARGYDWILIDSPPSLGSLTLNSLVAADRVLIPFQAEFFSLKGIQRLMDLIETVKEEGLNPELEIAGLLPSLVDERLLVTKEALAQVEEAYPDLILPCKIRRNVALSESSGSGKSVLNYAKKSLGAKDYQTLSDCLIEKRGLE